MYLLSSSFFFLLFLCHNILLSLRNYHAFKSSKFIMPSYIFFLFFFSLLEIYITYFFLSCFSFSSFFLLFFFLGILLSPTNKHFFQLPKFVIPSYVFFLCLFFSVILVEFSYISFLLPSSSFCYSSAFSFTGK